ncbi:30S ribosomal protein S3 [Candidatus Micrarchaeota archaeon]|nr:30S ribosomal protein S3 [Candidatus Micrarchaeota archaeon]
MGSERKIIKKALEDFVVKEVLMSRLKKAGVSNIIIQKTPLATRITLYVRRPGIVVGKGGQSIRELCELLQNKYDVENPQLDVIEVENPDLDAFLMAEKIGRQIEMRGFAKQLSRVCLNDIMNAGAIGAEIRVAGKIVGKGGKAKVLKIRKGYLKKSGDLMKQVRVGRYTAYPKAGAIGITVKIVPPGVVFPDSANAQLSLLKPPAAAEAAVPVEGLNPVEPSLQEEKPLLVEAEKQAPAEEREAPLEAKPVREETKKRVRKRKQESGEAGKKKEGEGVV